MRKVWMLALVLAVASAGPANAQLGELENLAKKAAKKAAGGSEKKADEAQSAGDTGRARPSPYKGKARKYPPGLSFSSLLNGVKLLPKNGQFRLHHIQASFLPDDCKGGFVVLRTADKKELYQFDWKPERLKKPYALLNFTRTIDLTTGKDLGGLPAEVTKPGDYVLDFCLPEELFYSFPFSVAKVGSDDAFGDGDAFVLNGDWATCGYLYYRDADPTQSLFWKVWLRSNAPKQADAKLVIEITKDGDSKPVCMNRPNTTFGLNPDWTRYEFDMIFPPKGTSGGGYFKAKNLLATDGDYTLAMKVNDKAYGVWKFAIKGGKLNYTGRTLRDKADPLTFIEGGRDAWWYVTERGK